MSLRMHAADVHILSGEPKRWATLSDDGERKKICHFCATCGIRLWIEFPALGFMRVKPGTLDDTSRLAPRYEGWTKRKLPWLTIEGLKTSFIT